MNMKLIAASMAVAFAFAAAPAMAEGDVPDEFGKCKSCHKPVADNQHSMGPSLNGVCGRALGAATTTADSKGKMFAKGSGDTKHSKAYQGFMGDNPDFTWTKDNLDKWLTKPADLIKGTSMKFGGFSEESQREAIIKYLGCDD